VAFNSDSQGQWRPAFANDAAIGKNSRRLRRSLDEGTVTMADFEKALTETRASVTEEMLDDYAKIRDTLKSDAVRPVGGIGFVLPGTLRPRNPSDGKG
jgi:transitional endoplasmic reticulum ATPase